MTGHLPLLAIEDALWRAATAALPARYLVPGTLAAAVMDRARRYTSERERLTAPADRQADLAARALFYTVCDAAKIHLPLAELAPRWRRGQAVGAPLRIVDVGAGCGAMVAGALGSAALAGHALEITLLDTDEAALAIGKAALAELLAGAAITGTVATARADVARPRLPAADLVVIGSVLNELPEPAAAALLVEARRAVGEGGAVIVVEPALRETSRRLHALRDAAVATGATIVGPCTHDRPACPMLADERDWCHETRPLVLPPRTADLARRTHLRDSGMKFSYLVLAHPAALLPREPGWSRMINEPVVAKGKRSISTCGEDGHVVWRRLQRHREPANRGFDVLERGDVARATELVPTGEGVDLIATSRVDRR